MYTYTYTYIYIHIYMRRFDDPLGSWLVGPWAFVLFSMQQQQPEPKSTHAGRVVSAPWPWGLA
jgi:hypothetical protein